MTAKNLPCTSAHFHTHVLFLIILCLPVHVLNAQRNSFLKVSKVKPEDFKLSNPLISTSTNAVIIFDKGDVSFEGNKKGWFSYIYKRVKRILILNNTASDLATVQLMLYKDGENKETVEDMSGLTFYVENGTVVETQLNLKDVMEEKYDKNHLLKKFALPAVKEGSIIEYSYIIKSDFVFNIPSWEFQNTKYPTLWSEYNIAIPGLLSYMSVQQGFNKFEVNKAGDRYDVFRVSRSNANGGALVKTDESLSVSTHTNLHKWAMKDIPAFSAEKFVFSPTNFIDKISFQLYKTFDGEDYHDVASNWKKVSEELMQREDFAQSVSEENYWLDKVLAQIVNAGDHAEEGAKKIFYYVQQNFTCNDHDDKYIKTSLHDVVKKKSGTVGDLNLLLIAMLRHEKFIADPVLLSTTEFGRNSPTYPLMEKLNYVICRTRINGVDYFLDATVPLLPFGKLPLNCYNGHARVISPDTTAVYFDPDALKEDCLVSVFIANTNGQDIQGSLVHKMGFFESLDTRTEIQKKSLTDYENHFKTSSPEGMLLSNFEFDSLEKIESPLTLKADFKLTAFDDADIVYFNPILGEAVTENPFISAERSYNVEMPYTKNHVYTLNMEIPKGYYIDEMPKSAKAMLNEEEGSFEYLVTADEKYLQLRAILKINKATFDASDYQTLRDFYAFVLKKESGQIVFKKIKS